MHWAMLLAVGGATMLQMHESDSLGSVLLLIGKWNFLALSNHTYSQKLNKLIHRIHFLFVGDVHSFLFAYSGLGKME